MENLGALFTGVLHLFQTELSLYGFSFSWWQVFLWTAVAAIVARILMEVFLGE